MSPIGLNCEQWREKDENEANFEGTSLEFFPDRGECDAGLATSRTAGGRQRTRPLWGADLLRAMPREQEFA